MNRHSRAASSAAGTSSLGPLNSRKFCTLTIRSDLEMNRDSALDAIKQIAIVAALRVGRRRRIDFR